MSNLFKKLVGNFVEIPEEKEEKLDPSKPIRPQVTPTTTTPVTTGFPSSYPIVSNMPTATGSSTVTDLNDFRKHFQTILEQANVPGIDYYEFIQAKNNMPFPVEEQKYKVAFQAQSAAGLTKDILLKTGQHYIEIIENELKEFLAGFDETFKQQVESKQAIIDQKKQQMLDLSNQINALNQEITSMKDEVSESTGTLTGKKNAFVQVATETKDTISLELSNIDKYIS